MGNSNNRRPYQCTLVRAWNIFSAPDRRRGLRSRLRTECVMQEAVQAAGHSDFGEFEFVEGLEQLIRSVEATGNLHAFGRFFFRKLLTAQLVHRLKLTAWIKRNPGIREQRICSPLIILGMPRTGSTFLFNLLAQDSRHRYVRNFEAVVSQVPPSGRYDSAHDPRRRSAKRLLKFQQYLAPDMKSMHDFTLDGPEECTPLLMQSFTLAAFGSMFNVPDYMRWLSTAPRLQMYQYHRQILQTLQWKSPARRWLLKCPLHMDALQDLLSVYPEACLVHTHRDPAQSVPSYASLSATFRGITTRQIDRTELGLQSLDLLGDSYARFSRQRLRLRPERIMDVAYADLTRDPMRTLQQIYRHAATAWSEDARNQAQHFLDRDRGVPRSHRYTAQEFGLTSSQIRERFNEPSQKKEGAAGLAGKAGSTSSTRKVSIVR